MIISAAGSIFETTGVEAGEETGEARRSRSQRLFPTTFWTKCVSTAEWTSDQVAEFPTLVIGQESSGARSSSHRGQQLTGTGRSEAIHMRVVGAEQGLRMLCFSGPESGLPLEIHLWRRTDRCLQLKK
jgi:hypothetical protein